MRRFIILAAAALAGTAAQAQTIAITGGKVYPVSGPAIENGTVLIRDGKIAAVGANVSVPADAQRIDATGKWVTPGLINAATTLGLVEIGLEGFTRDVSARGRDNIAAAFTVWEGFNAHSVYLAPAREEGVTSVLIAPSGGLVSGQAAFLTLADGWLNDMLLRAPVAMIAEVGDKGAAGVGARAEVLVKLRELFEDTRAYQRNRSAFERGETRDYSASRLDLEAMIPVLEGRLPVIVVADKAEDIQAALKTARDYNLRLIIAGGAEGWMIADELRGGRVTVMTGAMNNIPGWSSLGQRQDNAALLRRAGVNVVLIGNGPGDPELFNVRNIRQEAGNAVAYGMTWDDALRAVTLGPAELFGVADKVGSLQPGREANVVIWNGDPFELLTNVDRVFVRGQEKQRNSRQHMQTERYRNLPPDYRKP